jgi:FtsP/CotA-like multicopper oxidase with cupredoxin domain
MLTSRRTLLVGSTASAAAIGAGVVISANRLDKIGLAEEGNAFFTALPIPQLLDARELGNTVPLVARAGVTEFVPNFETEAYGYSAPSLGPVVRVYRGDTVRKH